MAGLAVLLLMVPTTSAQAQEPNSVETPDSRAILPKEPSMVLDESGFPIVLYTAELGRFDELTLMRCNDVNCAGSDESTVVLATTSLGPDPSIVLDASGFPVIAFTQNGDLKLIHCNDLSCIGGDESLELVDPGRFGDLSRFGDPSLQLDGNGFPVIAYYRSDNRSLKLAHCNDVNCAGGDDKGVRVDGEGDVGWSPSLVLDPAGLPIVTYNSDGGIKVVRCNDPACRRGDENPASPDGTFGWNASIALDADGYPVISYRSSEAIRLVHCNDPACMGMDESAVDLEGNAWVAPMVLDSDGNPVIAFHDIRTLEIKVLRCTDPLCASGDETIVAVDKARNDNYFEISLALDADSRPVLSYHDQRSDGLRVLHCSTPTCEVTGLPARCRGVRATIVATSGVTYGTEGDDVILGWDGRDRIYGGGGDDLICGGAGDDRIYGGDGDDEIYGKRGADRVWGNHGMDRIYGGTGDDKLLGNPGSDDLRGQSGNDRLSGGRGDDYLAGGSGTNILID